MFHHLVSDPQVSTKYGDFEQNYMFFIFILKKSWKKVWGASNWIHLELVNTTTVFLSLFWVVFIKTELCDRNWQEILKLQNAHK